METLQSFSPSYLKQLATALDEEGIKNLIDEPEVINTLCQNTTFSSYKMLVDLGFNVSQIQTITENKVDYNRNYEIYQLVRKKGDSQLLLKALSQTDNNHIIKFIAKEINFIHDNNNGDDDDDSPCQTDPIDPPSSLLPPSSSEREEDAIQVAEAVEVTKPLMPTSTTAPISELANSSRQRSDDKKTFCMNCDNPWIAVLLCVIFILFIVIVVLVGILLHERTVRAISAGVAPQITTNHFLTTNNENTTNTTTTESPADKNPKVPDHTDYFRLDIDSPVTKLQATTAGTLLHLIIRSNFMTSSCPPEAGMKMKKYNWLIWRPHKTAAEFVRALTLEGPFDAEEIEHFWKKLPNLETLCFKETCLKLPTGPR